MIDLSFSGPKDHLHSVVKTATSVAKLVLYEFDGFYFEFQQLTAAAKTAFESRKYQTALRISEEKLALYSSSMYSLSKRVPSLVPVVIQKPYLWDVIESNYQKFVSDRWLHGSTYSGCRA